METAKELRYWNEGNCSTSTVALDVEIDEARGPRNPFENFKNLFVERATATVYSTVATNESYNLKEIPPSQKKLTIILH